MQIPNLITSPPAKLYHKTFKSLTDLLKQASEPAEYLADMYRVSRSADKDGWSGGSFEKTVELATYGWEEGFQTITELTKKHRHIFDDLLPKQDYAKQVILEVEGEAVDVGLAVQGVPECMLTTVEDSTTKIIPGNKLQRIFYQNSFNSFITKETVFNYGAVICCLINCMELHGFRTEVIVKTVALDPNSSGVTNTNGLFLVDTTVKEFEESPDYNKLAFAIASAAYHRRLIFALEEQQNQEFLKIFGIPNGGYGRPANYKADLVTATDIYIPYIQQNLNFDTIVKNFRQLLEIHFKESSAATTKQKEESL